MRRSRLKREMHLSFEVQLRSEPAYVVEIMLDNPESEGISSRSLHYTLVKAEAKRRGIKKGDSLKRMRELTGG